MVARKRGLVVVLLSIDSGGGGEVGPQRTYCYNMENMVYEDTMKVRSEVE